MDILFINATPNNELRYKINGTMILATKLIQAGFDVNILRFYEIDSYDKGDYNRFIDDTVNEIISKNPKCVSFYTLWPFYHIIIRLSKRLKEIEPNIIIVFGGPQSSATPYETMQAMDFVDYISTGEGENTVVPFFTSILKNKRKNIEEIPGLYYRKNGEICFCDKPIEFCDLDTIPRWDEKLYVSEEKALTDSNYFMPIDVGRGCPFNCTFCCTSIFWKRAYRLKSPQSIIDDIKFFNQKFGIRSFMFSHDAFTVNKKIVTEVCDKIIENKLDIVWKCTTRADCIDDELIIKMKQAGLKFIEMGIETGSPVMQKTINKKLDLDLVKNRVEFLLKNKINVALFFVYGFPEETENDLNQTINYYCDLAEMGVKQFSMSFCRFNPSTHITQKYFNDLVFDPSIKILSRDIFGYDEEIEMIKNNKALFPFFFHYNTPVRNNYQYLVYFASLYKNYYSSLKFIRRLYKNNMLEFYRNFYENNMHIFNKDITVIQDNYINNKREMLVNTIKNYDKNIIKTFTALLDFNLDLQTVTKSKVDINIQKEYNFSYIEYMMNIPIEKFSNSKTELSIEKIDGKVKINVVSI